MSFDWRKAILTIAPKANVTLVIGLSAALEREVGRDNSLRTVRRVAHLLGQMAVETMGFTKLDENLNYSAKRLTEVWPNRYPTIAAAAPYAGNPQALANKTYNGRMGNRPNSDDGWFFRGCGGLHHTGRDEHKARAAAIGVSIVDFGTLMRDFSQGELILKAAISYCDDRQVWDEMDANDVTLVTLRINGGKNGLADRSLYTTRALSALRGLVI